MKITIKGRPASKKNNRRNYGRVSLPSLAYIRFEKEALKQLKVAKEYFDIPVSVVYQFKQKGKFHQDIDNAIASINDVLQEAGILKDDDLVIEISAGKKGGFTDWETDVIITPI